MKRYFTIMMALLLAVAVAAPAFADVEWKFGGQFRARFMDQQNNTDANDDGFFVNGVHKNDHITQVDQRLRLYMTAQASKNLKMVVRFEMGDTQWGNEKTGGGMGADGTIVELKNAYIEFKIPETPVTAIVGIQPIALMNSWIADDDFSAAVVKAPFGPFTFAVGYVAGQNTDSTVWQDNIDGWIMTADYANGPWSASLVGVVSDLHKTAMTDTFSPAATASGLALPWGPFPGVMNTPWRNNNGTVATLPATDLIDSNLLADIGVNLGYKIDWMTAYVSFVKNLGSLDLASSENTLSGFNGLDINKSTDYTGWMVDAGATFFCGPYTLNIGGFYTTGQDIKKIVNEGEIEDFNNFTYPLTTSKYFSEIIGGGILDNIANYRSNIPTGLTGAGLPQWSGYQFPSNLWTVTVGGAWQVLEKTKLSLSYWYFGTSEDVVGFGTTVDDDGVAHIKWASDIGHEIDFYITQGITDGLTLDLVAAYLVTGDAFSTLGDDGVYELGARLQWNF